MTGAFFNLSRCSHDIGKSTHSRGGCSEEWRMQWLRLTARKNNNMEFPFDVNQVLPFEVTILNGDYRVLNPGASVRIAASERLSNIIDAIGEASYKAQGLHGAVTTARKLRASEHRLYIIKKADDYNNRGSVIGILKVGPKHLYIYDTNGEVYERTPLCVLDFYVHESRQRLGYGRKLFDTMLNFEKCAPYELPVDRPSSKCLGFLHKHYNLSSPIHQVNNYVVFQGFFNQPSHTDANGSKASQPEQRPAHSYYSTSYNRHYNQNPAPFPPPEKAHSAPRPHPQVNNQHLRQSPATNQHSALDNYRRTVEFAANVAATQPPLTKPAQNSAPVHPTTHSSSSSWRIFGVHQLPH